MNVIQQGMNEKGVATLILIISIVLILTLALLTVVALLHSFSLDDFTYKIDRLSLDILKEMTDDDKRIQVDVLNIYLQLKREAL